MTADVEHESWLSRIVSSLGGVLVGLLLFLGSFPLLFWNEGRAVRRAQDLEQGREAVVEVEPDRVDPALDGELVHLSSRARTEETVRDAALGVEARAIHLVREVEMYQWREDERTRKEKRIGGGTRRVTEYTYEREWSSRWLDSSDFREAAAHRNPPMPVEGRRFSAEVVTAGARVLSPELVAQIDRFEPLPVAPDRARGLETLGGEVHQDGRRIYVGRDPRSPAIGDLRISWRIAPPTTVSVLAAQRGDTFSAWETPRGRTLEQNLEVGQVSAAEMLGRLEERNALLTWGLRFGGWLLCFMGIRLMFRPLSVVADLVPLVGTLVGGGVTLAALVLSVPLSLAPIAAGWFFHRPLLALGLLGAGLVFGLGLGALVRSRGKSKTAQLAAARGYGAS